jgi:hypothetical protein
MIARPSPAWAGRAALAVIIAASLGLALFWVVRLPFFQSPDENAHADYSFTLFTTMRPLRAAAKVPATNVHPLLRYLEERSGFRSMRLNSEGRVPPGYGSRAFFRDVDARAPSVDRDFLKREGDRVPYVAQSYAYLYYALDAVAIGVASIATGGSASAEYLAARGFNLVLLALSLLLCYGTLRELRVRVPAALAMVATIGFLPLTSWVSAYVQPDNLSFTAVALALYLAIRLRREPDGMRAAFATGLALALLALTKQQYLLAVAVPLVADRTLRFAARRESIARWTAYTALTVVPALLAGLSLRWSVASSGAQVGAIVAANNNPIAAAAAGGPAALLAHVAGGIAKALGSIYYNGFTFFGFWGEFSWDRTQITFGSPEFTSLVFALLGAASVLVALLVCVRVVLRVWPRLFSIARRRGIFSAARLAASDVPLNAYVCFVALMIVVQLSTDGSLGDEGRYYLPFVLPALLCATRYGPRALPRRIGAPLARILGGGALAYACLAATAAPGAIERRFYAAPVHPADRETWALVQRLGPYRITSFDPAVAMTFAPNAVVPVKGVAIDSRSDLPAQSVELLVDGRVRAKARLGYPDPLILDNMHDDALLDSGFTATLDLHGLAPGPHELRLAIGERTRATPYVSLARVRFSIEPRRADS